MDQSARKFTKFFINFGGLLILLLAFWAGDWWTIKLIFTIPIGVVAYYSIVIFSMGGTAMHLMGKKKE